MSPGCFARRIEPGSGQARDIAWAHPVQHRLRGVVVAGGDAGLQVDDAKVRRQFVEDLQGAAPWSRVVDRLGEGPGRGLGKRDVVLRAGDLSLRQTGITRYRQNLVHTSARHHVAAQAQHDQTPIVALADRANWTPSSRRRRADLRSARAGSSHTK